MANDIATLALAMREASPEVIKNFLYRIQASAWEEGHAATDDPEFGPAVNPYRLLAGE